MLCAVIFCTDCGSPEVEVAECVNQFSTVIRCTKCGKTATVYGFTLGRMSSTKLVPWLRTALLEAAGDVVVHNCDPRGRRMVTLGTLDSLAKAGDVEAGKLLAELLAIEPKAEAS